MKNNFNIPEFKVYIPIRNKKLKKQVLKSITNSKKWRGWDRYISKELENTTFKNINVIDDWTSIETQIELFEDWLYQKFITYMKFKDTDFYVSNKVTYHPEQLHQIIELARNNNIMEAKTLADQIGVMFDTENVRYSLNVLRRKHNKMRSKSKRNVNRNNNPLENARRILQDMDSQVNCPITDDVLYDALEQKLKCETVNIQPFTKEVNSTVVFPDKLDVDFITRCISRLKNGKTPGIDGLPYEIIKKSKTLRDIITTIINTCIKHEKIPRRWRCIDMVLLYKSGDINEVNSYRPISMSAIIYKIYMSCLANWSMTNITFKLPQKGFLQFEGCPEHNRKMRDFIRRLKKKKKDLYMLFIDIKNAFTSVSHEVLIQSLKYIGYNTKFNNIIQDIYRENYVYLPNDPERKIPMKVGVKQGCPLSPILFNCVMDGLIKTMNTKMKQIENKGGDSDYFVFADDMAFGTNTTKNMKQLFKTLESILVNINLDIGFGNPIDNVFKKTALMAKKNINKKWQDDLDMKLIDRKNTKIPLITNGYEYRYLGVNIGKFEKVGNTTNKRKEIELDQKLDKVLRTISNLKLKPQEKIILYNEVASGTISWTAVTERISTQWLKKRDRIARNNWKAWIGRGSKCGIPSDLIHLNVTAGGIGLCSCKHIYDCNRIRFIASLCTKDEFKDSVEVNEIQWCKKILKSWNNVMTWEEIVQNKDPKTLIHDRSRKFFKDKSAARLPIGNRSLNWNDNFRISRLNYMGQKLYRFIWESRSNMLNTAKRISKWKKINLKCHCGQDDIVQHVVGYCPLNLGIYRKRHNLVNKAICQHLKRSEYTTVFSEHAPIHDSRRFDIWLEPRNEDKNYTIESSVVWNSTIEEKEKMKDDQYTEHRFLLNNHFAKEHEQVTMILGQIGGYSKSSYEKFERKIKTYGTSTLWKRLQGISIYGSFWAWLARCRRYSINHP